MEEKLASDVQKREQSEQLFPIMHERASIAQLSEQLDLQWRNETDPTKKKLYELSLKTAQASLNKIEADTAKVEKETAKLAPDGQLVPVTNPDGSPVPGYFYGKGSTLIRFDGKNKPVNVGTKTAEDVRNDSRLMWKEVKDQRSRASMGQRFNTATFGATYGWGEGEKEGYDVETYDHVLNEGKMDDTGKLVSYEWEEKDGTEHSVKFQTKDQLLSTTHPDGTNKEPKEIAADIEAWRNLSLYHDALNKIDPERVREEQGEGEDMPPEEVEARIRAL